MWFSAIIPATSLEVANATLEAAGYGPGNFSVPLWRGDNIEPDSYGMNSAYNAGFREIVASIQGVSIQDSAKSVVQFDEHVASLGLKREPTYVPEPFEAPS